MRSVKELYFEEILYVFLYMSTQLATTDMYKDTISAPILSLWNVVSGTCITVIILNIFVGNLYNMFLSYMHYIILRHFLSTGTNNVVPHWERFFTFACINKKNPSLTQTVDILYVRQVEQYFCIGAVRSQWQPAWSLLPPPLGPPLSSGILHPAPITMVTWINNFPAPSPILHSIHRSSSQTASTSQSKMTHLTTID